MFLKTVMTQTHKMEMDAVLIAKFKMGTIVLVQDLILVLSSAEMEC